MKILWIVNTIFPYPASQIGQDKNCFGGWLNGLADKLKDNENIKLAIATVYNGKDIKKFDDGKIIYYLIPGAPALKYNSKLEAYWKNVNSDFQPDLVHIHGTEFAHGLAFRRACPKTTVVTSIQGLVSKIATVYYAGLARSEIMKNITIRDVIRKDSIFAQKKKFAKRGQNEIEIIKKSDAIIGRTTWDYANVKALDKNARYFSVNETLREEFYDNSKWDINNIERHSILFSQASYPIKGLHVLLDSINLLKEKYPNIKVYVAGYNLTNKQDIKSRIKTSGYSQIIKNKIRQYKIEKNVIFTGELSGEQMRKMYLKVNAFVLSSIIENESNSLSEAAILGLPTISSYVGGIPDRIVNMKNGLLYPFTETAMLANCIEKIFDNDELAIKLGQNAMEDYKKILNPENNVKQIIKIYNEMINKEL